MISYELLELRKKGKSESNLVKINTGYLIWEFLCFACGKYNNKEPSKRQVSFIFLIFVLTINRYNKCSKKTAFFIRIFNLKWIVLKFTAFNQFLFLNVLGKN